MKKWQKFFLIFLVFLYLIGIISVLWAALSQAVSSGLERLNASWQISPDSLINDYFIFLLGLSLIFLFIFLFYPISKTEFILEKEKGCLTLTNHGLAGFVESRLVHEGMENIRLSIKNYRRHKKISILADSLYKKETIQELPRIKSSLEKDLLELLDPEQKQKIKLKINLHLNQISSKSSKSRTARVA